MKTNDTLIILAIRHTKTDKIEATKQEKSIQSANETMARVLSYAEYHKMPYYCTIESISR